MRYLLLPFFCFFAASLSAQPQQFKLRPMTGFFLDGKVPLKNGPNFFVISDRRKFIKYFGLINKPDTPNFDFEHVVVMALKPTKKASTVAFMPVAAKAANYIEIYCMLEYTRNKLPYIAYPIVVAAIPKYFSVTMINFYNNENKKLFESVRIK